MLQRNARALAGRPGLLLGWSALITGLAQVGLALEASQHWGRPWGLAMAYLIGLGTASLLAGTNLIIQVHAPQVLRGRMAGLGQIAFLGGGGLSGLLAAGLSLWPPLGVWGCFAVLGSLGILLAIRELVLRRHLRLD